jgi:hypothetical protein
MPRLNNFGTRAYTYRVTDPPNVLPVELSDVKQYLKVTTSNDDALITALITQATDFAEKFTKRDFITRTYQTFRDYFPRWCDSEGYYSCGAIPTRGVNAITVAGGNIGFELRRSPLQEVSAVEYLVDTVFTIVPTSIYYTTVEDDYSEVLTLPDEEWPEDADKRLQAIRITFLTGFGDDSSAMPSWVTIGINQHVAAMYEDRGDCAEDCSGVSACACASALPPTARALYLQNRIINL